MLKPQDIMIGDYLLADGKVIQVAAVHLKKVGYHERHDKLTWVRLDRLEYIKITPETLQAFGFGRQDDYSSDGIEAWLHKGRTKEDSFIMMFNKEGLECWLYTIWYNGMTSLRNYAISDLQHFFYDFTHGKVMPIELKQSNSK